MALHIVRLGSPRLPGEGLRVGTVRRPPRGVPKADYASGNWFDVWFPNLAPSVEAMKAAQAAVQSGSATEWAAFARRYRSEMAAPERQHELRLLAALSHDRPLSVGCYCEDESRCHRSLLRALLAEAGADLA